jgi:hypothetical protein
MAFFDDPDGNTLAVMQEAPKGGDPGGFISAHVPKIKIITFTKKYTRNKQERY